MEFVESAYSRELNKLRGFDFASIFCGAGNRTEKLKMKFADALDAPPTLTTDDGCSFWYNENGELHRDFDLPAVVKNGEEFLYVWMRNGVQTRGYGLPSLVDYRGRIEYTTDGMLSRSDGPALITPNGDMHWYWCDMRHTFDRKRPAIVRANGELLWYQHNECICIVKPE